MRRARAGFTVVELLMALFLTALLFAVIWSFFGNAVTNVQAGREGATMNRLFRLAMLHAREDLENAVAVREAGQGKLSFRMVRGFEESGRAIVDEVAYSVERGEIVRRASTGDTRMGGKGERLTVDFRAGCAWLEDGGIPRYEVSFVLTGRDARGNDDSLEIRVVPPMMAQRRSILWASPPEE